MEYAWVVTGMSSVNTTVESNIIMNVRWTLTGTDAEGVEGVFNGATPLASTDIDPTTFVPYDQLTQALVLSWVQPIVENNTDYWKHINEQINNKITSKKQQVNPDISLPWNPTPITTPPAS